MTNLAAPTAFPSIKLLPRRITLFAIGAAAGLSLLGPARAAVNAGDVAPALAASDRDGRAVNLADYKSKIVVLEWTNPECPFVKQHYNSGNLPTLQREATAAGVVWLDINSSHSGAQGDYDAAQAHAWLARHQAHRPHICAIATARSGGASARNPRRPSS